jgi:hypothetical protein
LLQHLRVANNEDFVVGGWPFALSFPPKLYKHVGMNLELFHDKFDIMYPKPDNVLQRVFRVSLLRKLIEFLVKLGFKDIGSYVLGFHGENLINDRLYTHRGPKDVILADQIKQPYNSKNVLAEMTIDDLYNDKTLVGDFSFALKSKGE